MKFSPLLSASLLFLALQRARGTAVPGTDCGEVSVFRPTLCYLTSKRCALGRHQVQGYSMGSMQPFRWSRVPVTLLRLLRNPTGLS